MAVTDDPAQVPATANFQVTWRAVGGRRRLGHPRTAAPTDPAAFDGRLFTRVVATGVFSGTAGGFTFTSDAKPRVRGVFAELGTERNGVFLSAAAACQACAAGRQTPAAW